MVSQSKEKPARVLTSEEIARKNGEMNEKITILTNYARAVKSRDAGTTVRVDTADARDKGPDLLTRSPARGPLLYRAHSH